MSIWNTVNEDARSLVGETATGGARLGFLGALEAAYDESVRYSSMFGAEIALQDEEQENMQRIRKAGGAAPEPLQSGLFGLRGGTRNYTDFIEALNSGNDVAPFLGDRDAQLEKLRQQYPDAGIRTYRDMFGTVREKADEARKQSERERTFGGSVGGLIGGAAGAFNPRVNPLNVATSPIGGGSGVASRIAIQAAVGAASEAVGQFAGVRENQRMLGGDPSLGDAVSGIASAGVGGGLLQAGGELLGAGVRYAGRRWFRDAPAPRIEAEPAAAAQGPTLNVPEPPARMVPGEPQPASVAVPVDTMRLIEDTVRASLPGGKTRPMRRAAFADLEDMAAKLDTWTPDAPPSAIMPAMSTRLPGDVSTPEFDPIRARELTVDERARAADPTTMSLFDKLTDKANALRARIDNVDALRADAARSGAAVEARAAIDAAESRLAKTRPKQRQRIQDEIDELKASYDRDFASADQNAPTAAALQGDLRQQLMRTDEQLRDMAPAVSRAYARARQEWGATDEVRAAVEAMTAQGGKQIPPSFLPEKMPDTVDVPITLRDKVPELQVDGARMTDGPAAVEVQRVAAEQQKIADEAVASFRASLARVLQPPKEGDVASTVVEYNGRTYNLDDVADVEITSDGAVRTLTVREALAAMDEEEQVLKAVTTCQIPVRASSNAS